MIDTGFFCVLSHEGVLQVQGTDAEKFLQGQLSCDVSSLSTAYASLGTRCTAKGRMQSSFRIQQQSEECYLLAMAQELIEPQLADLQKYAVFSKSNLQDVSGEWVRFGLYLADAILAELNLPLAHEANRRVQHQELSAIRLHSGHVELWVPRSRAQEIQAQLTAHLQEAPLSAWLLHQIQAGIGQVFAGTWEHFVPQMLNLQTLEAVSFKKGCYTGQEIVARTQYLGKLKRHMHRFALESKAIEPQPGMDIFPCNGNSSVGEVVMSASLDHTTELLAVLQDEILEQDVTLHLGSAQGPKLSLQKGPESSAPLGQE